MSVELLTRVRAEIEERLVAPRPALDEYEELLGAAEKLDSEPAPAPRGASEQAIVAALEHGSHTVGELVLVTAVPGPQLRTGAQRLQRAGVIGRTRREGRIAYALSAAVEE